MSQRWLRSAHFRRTHTHAHTFRRNPRELAQPRLNVIKGAAQHREAPRDGVANTQAEVTSVEKSTPENTGRSVKKKKARPQVAGHCNRPPSEPTLRTQRTKEKTKARNHTLFFLPQDERPPFGTPPEHMQHKTVHTYRAGPPQKRQRRRRRAGPACLARPS